MILKNNNIEKMKEMSSCILGYEARMGERCIQIVVI
jgi:hypothetical protein